MDIYTKLKIIFFQGGRGYTMISNRVNNKSRRKWSLLVLNKKGYENFRILNS